MASEPTSDIAYPSGSLVLNGIEWKASNVKTKVLHVYFMCALIRYQPTCEGKLLPCLTIGETANGLSLSTIPIGGIHNIRYCAMEADTHKPQSATLSIQEDPALERATEGAKLCLQQSITRSDNGTHSIEARRKTGSVITIIGSALANLSDGYQQSLASSTNVIFNHLLGEKVYTSNRQTGISNALLVGSVIGILVFGYTSDRFSRKGGMLVTSALVVVGSLVATLAFQVDGATNMLWLVTIARGAAGVGVGG